MEIGQIVALIIGATGFWQLIFFFLNFRQERGLKKAKAQSAKAQAEGHLIENWITWCTKLENRVKELEAVNLENIALKSRIDELEEEVETLKSENKSLKFQLNKLLNRK